jgi:hypothetical protein
MIERKARSDRSKSKWNPIKRASESIVRKQMKTRRKNQKNHHQNK